MGLNFSLKKSIPAFGNSDDPKHINLFSLPFFAYARSKSICTVLTEPRPEKQLAQWATIPHHGASIMFGDTLIYDAQRQVTLNLKH